MRTSPIKRLLYLGLAIIGLGAPTLLPAAGPAGARAADFAVYADSLAAGWADWSWDSAVNLSNAAPVRGGGGASVAVTYGATPWGGLRLHANTALSAAGYSAVRFWVHGGASGGQAIEFKVITADPATAAQANLVFAPERLSARRIASPTASTSTMFFSTTALGGNGSTA